MTHHRTIKSLVEEVRQLRAALEGACDSVSYAENAVKRANRSAREAEDEADSVRRDKESRRWEIEQVIRNLERSREYDDKYAQDHALARLKRALW